MFLNNLSCLPEFCKDIIWNFSPSEQLGSITPVFFTTISFWPPSSPVTIIAAPSRVSFGVLLLLTHLGTYSSPLSFRHPPSLLAVFCTILSTLPSGQHMDTPTASSPLTAAPRQLADSKQLAAARSASPWQYVRGCWLVGRRCVMVVGEGELFIFSHVRGSHLLTTSFGEQQAHAQVLVHLDFTFLLQIWPSNFYLLTLILLLYLTILMFLLILNKATWQIFLNIQ